MGVIHNGINLAEPLINNVDSNALINGENIWNKDPSSDQTVLKGLELWCSVTKSEKTNTQWNDISKKNRHITLANATALNDSYLFNGTNTLGTIPLSQTIWQTGATCIVIAKYLTAANYKGIIGDSYAYGVGGFYLGQWENGTNFYGFFPPVDRSQLDGIAFNNSNFSNTTTDYNEIAVTYDRNILSLYINGNLLKNKVIGQVTVRSDNMKIGRGIEVSDRYFHGNIRDVKFYSRALSGDEVLRNYNQNKLEEVLP